MSNHKSDSNDFKKTLWSAANSLRSQTDSAEYKHIVLGLIFLKYISDTFDIQKNKIKQIVSDPKSDFFTSEDPKVYEKELEDRDYYAKDNVFWVPQNARWEKIRAQAKQPEIGSIIDEAMIKIENENKLLKGKLDKRFGRSQLEEGKLGQLIDLISKIGFSSENNSRDLLGEVYEYFLGQFAAAEGKKGSQFYTPRHIVKTLVSVISPSKGRVYDPCCGSGGMFILSDEFIKLHSGKRDDINIFGQESNPTTWRLAHMNLALRGLSADLGKEPGNTFSKDNFPDMKFDYILMNPPFNDNDWGGEKYENDKKWVYGTPPPSNANFAWVQHVLWKLNPNGQAGVVLSNGSMDSVKNNEGKIRENIIKDNLVEIIIELPSKLFFNTTIPACLWFFNKNKTKNIVNRSDEILIINAKNMGTLITRKQKILTDEDISNIVNIIESWRQDKNYENVSGLNYSAKLEEIKKNNFILLPARYIKNVKKEDNVQQFDQKITHLTTLLEQQQEEGTQLDKQIHKNLRKINK